MDREFLSQNEMKAFIERREINIRLGNLVTKYSLPSLSLLQYYAGKLGIDKKKTISAKDEELLVAQVKAGNKVIIKSIKEICTRYNMNADEQKGFYAIVLYSDKVCEYFLSTDTDRIMKKVSAFECEDKARMMTLIKDIDPEFDFNE